MLLKSFGSAFFAKVGVEGSNPFARSKTLATVNICASWRTLAIADERGGPKFATKSIGCGPHPSACVLTQHADHQRSPGSTTPIHELEARLSRGEAHRCLQAFGVDTIAPTSSRQAAALYGVRYSCRRWRASVLSLNHGGPSWLLRTVSRLGYALSLLPIRKQKLCACAQSCSDSVHIWQTHYMT
jgi:hypothetical protein